LTFENCLQRKQQCNLPKFLWELNN